MIIHFFFFSLFVSFLTFNDACSDHYWMMHDYKYCFVLDWKQDKKRRMNKKRRTSRPSTMRRKGYFFDPGVFSGDRHAVECLSLSSHCALRVKIHLEAKESSVTEARSLQPCGQKTEMNLPHILSHLCISRSAAPRKENKAQHDGRCKRTWGWTSSCNDGLLWPLCWGPRSRRRPCRTLDRTCLGSNSGIWRGCWASGSAEEHRLKMEPEQKRKRFVSCLT